jgi:predicted DNA-binding WGR domain protein
MTNEPRHTVYLRRIDPARRMAKFYEISIGNDLFGAILVTRRWGRIGLDGEGQQRIDEHASEEAAAQALEQLARAKTRRGYEPA